MDWPAREPEKRPPVTVAGVPAARVELADVTYGVTVVGQHEPPTKKETDTGLEPLLSATMAIVPSEFVKGTI